MKLYAGTDLHARNHHLGILNEEDKRIFHKKLPNDKKAVLQVLKPFKPDLQGIVVESTFNWYWYVDLLMEAGYNVHLANPGGMQRYKGLKHSDDKHDAFWLAHMLRLGILPEGYIYPKQTRPVRDLLRKRAHLVRLRTSLILSLQSNVQRNRAYHLTSNEIKGCQISTILKFFQAHACLELTGKVGKATIDFLSERIKEVEKQVRAFFKPYKPYKQLLTIPGVGDILAFTILLETGSMGRFKKVGNYVSYCRKVSSRWTSNGKVKGKGNKKNGNRYLAWAFSEAAEYARRYNVFCRAFYNKKLSKKHPMVARNALANKLARAAYYIMRNEVAFDTTKLFS